MKRNIFGGITILVVAMIVYLFNMYIIEIPTFASITYFGFAIFVLGYLYLIYEIKKGLPFMYGFSQRGGSNANSYVVIGLGLGIFCRNLGVMYFISAIIATIALSLIVYYIFSKK